MHQLRIALYASDPVSHAGLASYLGARPEFTFVNEEHLDTAHVFIVSSDRLSAEVVAMLRRSAAWTVAPVVLVINEITESELLTAVDCRVVAILPRNAVTADQFARSVQAAAEGGGVMPQHLVGELLKQVERLQHHVLTPNGVDSHGFTVREIDVLRLMADGLDTYEIAGKLSWSERTVKNVFYGITHRLKLRNRSHAVAYALRTGII